MSDFQIGQIFENEYPAQVAGFCSKNNAKIQVIETVEKKVKGFVYADRQGVVHPKVVNEDGTEKKNPKNTHLFCVFTDDTVIVTWPYNRSKFMDALKNGTTVPMKRYQIVEIPAPSIEELKTAKLTQLETAYLQWRNADAYLVSSLGFPADSDERANSDVNALVYSLEEKPEEARGTTIFRGYDNKFYPLTLEQLKTLKSEIGDNGQYSYQQKWAYEDAVKNATSKEELDAIEFVFQPLDATKANA